VTPREKGGSAGERLDGFLAVVLWLLAGGSGN